MPELPKGIEMFSRTGPAWSPKQIHEMPIDKVSPDPENVRKVFDQVALDELAASLKSRGLLQPITVTLPDAKGRAMIRHGERRWRAARLAGHKTIRVLIDPNNDDAGRQIDQFIENEQREGLSPSEVVGFVQERLATGMKANVLAIEIGKSKAAVSKLAALAEAPAFIMDRLDNAGVEAGYILMQCAKIDTARTKRFVMEAGEDIRKRAVVALHGELKGETESFAGETQQRGEGNHHEREELRVDDEQREGVGEGQGLDGPNPSADPSSLPSATSNQSAERKRANSKGSVTDSSEKEAPALSDYPAVEVRGRSARFISGKVVFDGQSEPEFVDLEA